MNDDTECPRCRAAITIPAKVAARIREVRRSLAANTFGNAGSVRCSECGLERVLVVDALLDAKKRRTYDKV